MFTKKDFQDIFNLADKDKSGKLTSDELVKEMRDLGYKGNEESLKSYFKMVDKDGDHKLDFEEFSSCMFKAPPFVHRTALMRRLFSRFDKDGSGQLDKKELQKATETLGDRFNDEDTAILMSIFDKDGSDTIDLEEFIKCFIQMKG